jgi:hypothetical protein
MKTRLHKYAGNVTDPEYEALHARLEAEGRRCILFCVPNGQRSTSVPDGEITLDTTHLFHDQWNTVADETGNGYRVFDWVEYYDPTLSRGHRWGHYLEVTAEMIEARKVRHACGFCGNQEDSPSSGFCDKCLDSPYLAQSELHLTRFLPVAESFGAKREPLTAEERAVREPLYIERQTTGKAARTEKQTAERRARILRDRERTIENAKTEADGFLWVLDNVPGVFENVIFYKHTGRFTFGWRKKLSADVVSRLLEVISEFPGSYDIKCEGGRTFSN